MKYYDWQERPLTAEENSVLHIEDFRDLDTKGRLILRIAYAKTLVNSSVGECRHLLRQFGDTPPHMLNFLTRSGLDLGMSVNKYIIPGLKCVYFEDNPLYHAYFQATGKLEDHISSLKIHEDKYKKFLKRGEEKAAKGQKKKAVLS